MAKQLIMHGHIGALKRREWYFGGVKDSPDIQNIKFPRQVMPVSLTCHCLLPITKPASIYEAFIQELMLTRGHTHTPSRRHETITWHAGSCLSGGKFTKSSAPGLIVFLGSLIWHHPLSYPSLVVFFFSLLPLPGYTCPSKVTSAHLSRHFPCLRQGLTVSWNLLCRPG